MKKITQAKQIIEGSTNLAKKIVGVANNNVETLATERYAVCQQCPNLTITSNCKLCGCFMPSKTRSTTATCPINKW
ncbi:hypothetical protein JMN32_19755 [Fulvivirga sp. 29W222]|uniref:Uncharacterized protein n=1 Tax=Fulvivirga marina TaxID=2494733 RepID=A0A937G513_9BACT|nr:DUF6171 family protein [Fulvivirga marina]MBL6448556.1 hypothetical protein [Fulvivirga marina]